MRSLLLCAGALALKAFFAAPAVAQGLDVNRDDVRQFVAEMQQTHGFDAASLTQLLRDVQPQARTLETIQRPAERTLAWWEYRQRFLTEDRIAGGVRVWQQHRDTLEAIARDSGVPPEYLVAITGVETSYGRITGNYRVLDSLATLAFDYPPRASFFRKELVEFLLMTREEGLDARTPRGSYAGAMGIAQFMPSSFRAYAVDGTDDGKRDLWNWGPDVFASIANYFTVHGWRRGEPVLVDAKHDAAPDDPATATAALGDTIAALRIRGYRFETPLPDTATTVLVPATQQSGQVDWRVGFQNFHVITRYNRSLMYAMAVHDLAQAIAARHPAASTTARNP